MTDLMPAASSNVGGRHKRPAGGAAQFVTPAKIRAREKAAQALELKKAGLTYRNIATQLGYRDGSSAHKAVRAALKDTVPQASVDEYRAIELERLENLWIPMYRRAVAGDRLCVDRCIAISQRRAALLGLDAPLRIQQAVITEQDFQQAIDRLNEEAAALEQKGRLDDGDYIDADAELIDNGGEATDEDEDELP